jgi:hypothetical protein
VLGFFTTKVEQTNGRTSAVVSARTIRLSASNAAPFVSSTSPKRHTLRSLVGELGDRGIAFGLGAAVLGLECLRAARVCSERTIGWVLVLCGAFIVVDTLIWISIGGA